MSMGNWVVAGDVNGQMVVLRTEKHANDLSPLLVSIDDELAFELQLDARAPFFSRVTEGRPFRRVNVAEPASSHPPILASLVAVNRVDADCVSCDELQPAMLSQPSQDDAQRLRAEVEALWMQMYRRAKAEAEGEPEGEAEDQSLVDLLMQAFGAVTDEAVESEADVGLSGALDVAPSQPSASTADVPPADLSQAEELMNHREQIMLRLTERDRYVLARRFALPDVGFVVEGFSSRSEVAKDMGVSEERVRQTERTALYRLRDTVGLKVYE